MTTKTRAVLIVGLILLVVAFFAGYWPARQQQLTAEAELETLRARVATLEDRVRAARVHARLLDLIDTVEAMNYGQAQQISSALYDDIRREVADTQDPQLRGVFQEILATRDEVTGALAKGDPAALTPIQRSERQLRPLAGDAASAR